MSLLVQFGALRTRELRELLQDEDKIHDVISCSETFQRVKRAAEKTLVSNQTLAEVTLSQKPQFRDAKLLLAMKYKELENLRSIIQAKQEILAERYSLHYAHRHLLKKINHAEEECEFQFQRFAEGKTTLSDFLDSFLSSRKLQHVRMFLLKKLQEVIELGSTQTLSEPQHHHPACLPLCSLTAAVLLPSCCHPQLLLPFGTHVNNTQCLQHLPVCHDYNEPLGAGAHGQGYKWPARPVRLQPLRVQQRRHQEAPQ